MPEQPGYEVTVRRRGFVLGILGALSALVSAWSCATCAATPAEEPFSFYFPTPEATVQRLLELARVTADDFVMDLGSGDGRIVMAAAKHFGARGLGIDIDAALVEKSNAEAKRQKLAGRVRFETGDVIAADISRASVVTLFLLPQLMARVQPKLLRELKPGARIVAHEFALSGWLPDETLILYAPTRNAGSGGDSTLRLWTVPANFGGEWQGRVDGDGASAFEFSIAQRFQRAGGAIRRGADLLPLTNVSVTGAAIAFTYGTEGTTYHVTARLSADAMNGAAQVKRGEFERSHNFSARRLAPPPPFEPAAR
jgi:hypothetical protein